MNWAVYAALLGWIPLSLCAFAARPGRRTALALAVGGYLFLPEAGIPLPGMIDLRKDLLIGLGLLLGNLLFDSRSRRGLRARWFDLPMFLWCAAPLPSSLANDLGIYNGLSGVIGATLTFGAPYFIGRVYFREREALADLARALVIGGLLYIPLCWFEIRMSPQLHRMLYGLHPSGFGQVRRLGGWRPTVFLTHGLCVGMWMAGAFLVAFGSREKGRAQRYAGLPPWAAVLSLGVTAVLCKSLGSIALMALGTGTLVACRRFSAGWVLAVAVALAPAYLAMKLGLGWRAESVVEWARDIDHDRALSLEGRILSDEILVEHALERPLFGWGGWNRLREGLDPILTDSFWSIALSQKGLVGLLGWLGALVLAQWLPLARLRRSGGRPRDDPVLAALIVLLAVHTLDSMVNAQICAPFLMAQGALIGWVPVVVPRRPAAAARR